MFDMHAGCWSLKHRDAFVLNGEGDAGEKPGGQLALVAEAPRSSSRWRCQESTIPSAEFYCDFSGEAALAQWLAVEETGIDRGRQPPT